MAIKKDAYYFSHDANARNDEKILCLIADFGLEGYGIYWMLIEMMHESTDGTLSHKMIKGLAFKLGTAEGLLLSFVSSCIELELFHTDTEKYWSERVKRNKENKDQKYTMLSQKRSEAGKKGMENRWSKDADNQEVNNNGITNDNKQDFVNNKPITNDNQKKEKESKVNEIKGNKSKEKEIVMPFGPEFKNLWDSWKEYKKTEHKFGYKSAQSEQAAMNELVELAGGIEKKAVAIIHQSFAKGWKGFFQLKNEINGQQSNSNYGKPSTRPTAEQLNKAADEHFNW